MYIKYNAEIDNKAIESNLKRLTNQVYKLLPNWEEAIDWKRPLTTIIEELAGMDRLFMHKQEVFLFFLEVPLFAYSFLQLNARCDQAHYICAMDCFALDFCNLQSVAKCQEAKF